MNCSFEGPLPKRDKSPNKVIAAALTKGFSLKINNKKISNKEREKKKTPHIFILMFNEISIHETYSNFCEMKPLHHLRIALLKYMYYFNHNSYY